ARTVAVLVVASSAAPQFAAGQACGDVRLAAASGRAGLFTLLRSDPAISKAQQTSTVNKKTKDTEMCHLQR
ncbi:hypothetical protein HaLaN_22010, partial [Haematococcus lacustris]